MALRSPAALFTVATLIWGSTWLGIKFQLGVVPADVSVAYRFAIAALLLAAWCASTRRPLRFSAHVHAFIALQGVLLCGLNYVTVYWAEQYATSGLVAVLFSTIVFMTPLGARLAFGTPLTKRMLVAASLGVLGVALLFLPELARARDGGDAALGIVLGLVATAIASAGTLASARNHDAGIPVLPGAAWAMGYGALTAAIVALVTGARWTFDFRVPYVASLLYLSVFGTVVAFGAYLTLIARMGPGRASYVSIATPVVAMALSTLFEDYRWTPLAAFGVVLAVAGNWLALAPRKSGSEEQVARTVGGST